MIVSLVLAAAILVIPPGREAQIQEYLGPGEPIAGCTLSDASIDRTEVRATYTCTSGTTLRVRLAHPDEVPDPTFETSRFAVTVEPSGPDATRFAAAFDPRLRARESNWTWTETHSAIPSAPSIERVVPWRWVLGFAILATLAISRARRTSRETRRVTIPLLAALVLASFVLRRAWVTPCWFHQNGQAPQWLAGLYEPSRWYCGPGFGETFRPALWIAPRDPTEAIFVEQGLLCALAIAALWIATRATGASKALSWAVALVVAAEPALARVSGSESYFATIHAFVALALATLALAADEERPSLQFLGALGAALLAGEAARVHPFAFAAVPAVPAMLVAHRRFSQLGIRRMAALACTYLGALLLLEAPDAYRRVISPVGGEWASHVSNAGRLPDIGAGVLLAFAALAVLACWRRERSVGYLALAAVYGVVAWKFRLQLAHVHPAVDTAYALMLATPVVPLVARSTTDLLHMVKPSYVALGFGALGLVHIAVTAKPVTTFPTDTLEELLVARWRSAIPRGSAVLYVSRAGNHMSVFPTRDANDVAMVGVSAEESASADGTSVTHYLHGSPCTTTAGRDACALLEARLMLEPVAREVLPARPSQFDLAFDRSEVPIVLYRVVGRR